MSLRIRIFVSSPGDVAEERVLATRVIRRLADEFADRAMIEPVFWEHEPLVATSTFQSQIPAPGACQVMLSILWSRIGTRLPSALTRADGSRYDSGTEYEFEDALAGHAARGEPDLLVYRKTAEAVVSLKDEADLLRRLDQKRRLDGFLNKWFHDAADGSLKAAFHPFETAAEFEELVEVHLRKLIVRRLPESLEPNAAASSPDAKATWTAGSPFRGLAAFDVEHAPVFFGRSRATGEAMTALRRQASAGRAFLLLLGASGSGKSSLARAGVVPLLTHPGVVEGVDAWRRCILRPSDATGGDAFDALAAALLRPEALPEIADGGTTAADLARSLRDDPAGVADVIAAPLDRIAAALPPRDGHRPQARLVVVVDQSEELFTADRLTPAARDAFVAAMDALARSGRAWVLATLRSDFYARCAEVPALVALKEGGGQYDLLLPTPDEIGQMIRRPAAAAGLRFEQEAETGAQLDDVLRDAAAASPESLPLLEFALEELYQRRAPDGRLTFAAYRDLGGVEGALTKRAEDTFGALPPAAQAQFPGVMRELVSAGSADDAGAARRKATVSDLARTPDARAFVEAFVAARLFTADRDESSPDGAAAVVSIAHEALLRRWPRLVRWLEENRDLLRVRDRVTAAAGRWAREGRRPDLLLPAGKPLEEARWLWSQLPAALAPVVGEFLEASEARARRSRTLKRSAMAVTVALAVVATAAALVARRAKGLSDDARRVAVAAEGDALRAKRLAEDSERRAVEQWRAAELEVAKGLTIQARGQLGSVARQHYFESRSRFAALNHPTSFADVGLAGLWNNTPEPLDTLAAGDAKLRCVAVRPGTLTAATGGDDGVVRLWDLFLGRQVRALAGHEGAVHAVAFSADGTMLVSAGADGTVRIWQSESGAARAVLRGHQGKVRGVAITPDGSVLSGGDDRTLRLWDAKTFDEIRSFAGHARRVSCVAVSPNGKFVAAASQDGNTKVWDAGDGRLVASRKEDSPVDAIAFAPNGVHVAIAIQGSWLGLWDFAADSHRYISQGHHVNAIRGIAFSLNGEQIVSAGQSHNVFVWDVATSQIRKRMLAHTDEVAAATFADNGQLVVSASLDGTLRVLNNAPRTFGREFNGGVWPIPGGEPALDANTRRERVTLSPDGRTAIFCGLDVPIVLFDLATLQVLRVVAATGRWVSAAAVGDGTEIWAAGYVGDAPHISIFSATNSKVVELSPQHTKKLAALSVSRDCRTAATAGEDGLVQLWDVGSRAPLRRLAGERSQPVRAVAFSPDGRHIASADAEGAVSLHSTAGGDLAWSRTCHKGGANCVAFSPDGHVVASGGNDRAINLIDVTTGRVLRTISGTTFHVESINFSPDGRLIMAGYQYYVDVGVWDADTGRFVQSLDASRYGTHALAISPDGEMLVAAFGRGAPLAWGLQRVPRLLEMQPKVDDARRRLAIDANDADALLVYADWYVLNGRDVWAATAFEMAAAAGADVSPLALAHCYWRAIASWSDPETVLARVEAYYRKALERAEAPEAYLRLCISAVVARRAEIEAAPIELVVERVLPGGQAEQLGLRAGDVLLTYNGEKLRKVERMIALANDPDPADRVIEVLRDGKTIRHVVKPGKLLVQLVPRTPATLEIPFEPAGPRAP